MRSAYSFRSTRRNSLESSSARTLNELMSIHVYFQKLNNGIIVTIGNHDIKLVLSHDHRFLTWRTRFFGLSFGSIHKIDLSKMIRITKGQTTSSFQLLKKPHLVSQSLSVFYVNDGELADRWLDLIIMKENDYDCIYQVLSKILHDTQTRIKTESFDELYTHHLWNRLVNATAHQRHHHHNHIHDFYAYNFYYNYNYLSNKSSNKNSLRRRNSSTNNLITTRITASNNNDNNTSANNYNTSHMNLNIINSMEFHHHDLIVLLAMMNYKKATTGVHYYDYNNNTIVNSLLQQFSIGSSTDHNSNAISNSNFSSSRNMAVPIDDKHSHSSNNNNSNNKSMSRLTTQARRLSISLMPLTSTSQPPPLLALNLTQFGLALRHLRDERDEMKLLWNAISYMANTTNNINRDVNSNDSSNNDNNGEILIATASTSREIPVADDYTNTNNNNNNNNASSTASAVSTDDKHEEEDWSDLTKTLLIRSYTAQEMKLFNARFNSNSSSSSSSSSMTGFINYKHAGPGVTEAAAIGKSVELSTDSLPMSRIIDFWRVIQKEDSIPVTLLTLISQLQSLLPPTRRPSATMAAAALSSSSSPSSSDIDSALLNHSIYAMGVSSATATPTTVSYSTWLRLLTSSENALYDPNKRKQYQSMEFPLSYYYIASSHNTYLEGDQLRSTSSVKRYIDDLLSGCRCVELDCWNGDEGEPVVYHGHTLTTKLSLREVMDAIVTFAFVTSPYPVILSLETHCDALQQGKMASIFQATFKDRLVLSDSLLVDEDQSNNHGMGSSSGGMSSNTSNHSNNNSNTNNNGINRRSSGASVSPGLSVSSSPSLFLSSPESLKYKFILKAKRGGKLFLYESHTSSNSSVSNNSQSYVSEQSTSTSVSVTSVSVTKQSADVDNLNDPSSSSAAAATAAATNRKPERRRRSGSGIATNKKSRRKSNSKCHFNDDNNNDDDDDDADVKECAESNTSLPLQSVSGTTSTTVAATPCIDNAVDLTTNAATTTCNLDTNSSSQHAKTALRFAFDVNGDDIHKSGNSSNNNNHNDSGSNNNNSSSNSHSISPSRGVIVSGGILKRQSLRKSINSNNSSSSDNHNSYGHHRHSVTNSHATKRRSITHDHSRTFSYRNLFQSTSEMRVNQRRRSSRYVYYTGGYTSRASGIMQNNTLRNSRRSSNTNSNPFHLQSYEPSGGSYNSSDTNDNSRIRRRVLMVTSLKDYFPFTSFFSSKKNHNSIASAAAVATTAAADDVGRKGCDSDNNINIASSNTAVTFSSSVKSDGGGYTDSNKNNFIGHKLNDKMMDIAAVNSTIAAATADTTLINTNKNVADSNQNTSSCNIGNKDDDDDDDAKHPNDTVKSASSSSSSLPVQIVSTDNAMIASNTVSRVNATADEPLIDRRLAMAVSIKPNNNSSSNTSLRSLFNNNSAANGYAVIARTSSRKVVPIDNNSSNNTSNGNTNNNGNSNSSTSNISNSNTSKYSTHDDDNNSSNNNKAVSRDDVTGFNSSEYTVQEISRSQMAMNENNSCNDHGDDALLLEDVEHDMEKDAFADTMSTNSNYSITAVDKMTAAISAPVCEQIVNNNTTTPSELAAASSATNIASSTAITATTNIAINTISFSSSSASASVEVTTNDLQPLHPSLASLIALPSCSATQIARIMKQYGNNNSSNSYSNNNSNSNNATDNSSSKNLNQPQLSSSSLSPNKQQQQKQQQHRKDKLIVPFDLCASFDESELSEFTGVSSGVSAAVRRFSGSSRGFGGTGGVTENTLPNNNNNNNSPSKNNASTANNNTVAALNRSSSSNLSADQRQNQQRSSSGNLNNYINPNTNKLLPHWAMYHKTHISRAYPAALRIDSSNFDPTDAWSVGLQLVALNYQTSDAYMRIYQGKFRENGGVGYVLKPEYLLTYPYTPPPTAAVQVSVTVISGWQLPKYRGAIGGTSKRSFFSLSSNSSSKGGIRRRRRNEVSINPYVAVSVAGGSGNDRVKWNTRTVSDNGFSPVWNETKLFTITCPDLALMTFEVRDEEVTTMLTKSRFIASSTIPTSCMRSGIRSVELYDECGRQLGDFLFASLLVYVQITPLSSSSSSSSSS